MLLPTSRKILLDLLASIDVNLPPRTKLSEEELEKRLRKALDCAQQVTQALSSTTPAILPVSDLQRWDSSSEKSLSAAFRRDSWEEITVGFQKRLSGQDPMYKVGSGNALMDIRHFLVNFALHWEKSNYRWMIKDEEQDSSMIFRVVDFLAVNDKTPVAIVLYHHAPNLAGVPTTAAAKARREGIAWVSGQAKRANPGMIQSTLPISSQQLLLRLLDLNSKRLPEGYDVAREKFESPFTLSFLLSIGPLDSVELGRMNSNTGCVMCGEKANKKCAGCLATYYCSSECQKADWKQHKAICKYLKDATWTSMEFQYRVVPKGTVMFDFSRRSRVSDMTGSTSEQNQTEPPVNTHGVQPFVAKVQRSSTAPPDAQPFGGLMVYDRKRTINVICPRPNSNSESQKVYDDIMEKILREGIRREKMFFWIRRIGPWELSLALDRLPAQDAQW